ncbi:MAG TPA: glycosyltransferase [Thermodesulfobacteriota bacterium]|nr:glycosyltransferase [Thermodesulfobacteriota bacterium]
MPEKIERMLFFAKTRKRTKTPAFFVKAFRNQGIEVKVINYRKWERRWGKWLTEKYIFSTYYRFKPQLVFINAIDIPFKMLSQISGKTKVAIYLPDLITPSDNSTFSWFSTRYKEEMIERGKLANYFFITNQGQIPFLKERGIKNPIFITQGCDREEHRIIKSKSEKWKSEVAFIGAAKDPDRVNLIKEINKHFNLKVWGGEWERHGLKCHKHNVYPDEFAKICSGSKIILGIDVSDQVEGYFSNRTWITLGCGGFLLTRYVPGLEKIFINKKHLVWYHNIDECPHLIAEYLKKDEERERISREGYHYVHEHHTYEHVVQKILGIIKKESCRPAYEKK